MLEKKEFRSYTLEEEKRGDVKVISLKLNKDEQRLLADSQKIIEQSKKGTAIKTLAWIGAKVIREEKTKYIIETLFKNKRNNKRNNIIDFD